MSRIYEQYMDEKQEELEFNEKEMLALKKYEQPIMKIRNESDNQATLAKLERNEETFGNWRGDE